MSSIALPIDHIGLAVTDLAASIALYTTSFGMIETHREFLESENIEVAFLEGANGTIELLTTSDATSALGRSLAKRGAGLHHLCFRSEDIKQQLATLEAQGHQLIDKTPRIGSRGKLIAFIHPNTTSGVLIEICQKN